ncbi:MAG: RNA-binding S4 domain-containing protein [Pyrinomonadaceae bacterium]
MRLDQFLKASRLVLRRTLAQAWCDAGVVLVNGRQAKSARAMSVGDEIELRYRSRLLKVRVKAVPSMRQTSREEASQLYEVISDTFVSE